MRWQDLTVVFRLSLAQAYRSPGRIILAALSTAAAACVVVWVVSGYDSLVDQSRGFSDKYLGRYELLAVPCLPPVSTEFKARPAPALSADVVDELRQDPAVTTVDAVYQTRVRISKYDPAGKPPARLPGDAQPMLVGTNAAEPPYALREGDWIYGRQSDRMEAAISLGAAKLFGIKVGDEVVVSGSRDDTGNRVTIIGIVDQLKSLPPLNMQAGMPSMRLSVLARGPADSALYVRTSLAQKLTGKPAQITYAGVVLQRGIKADEFCDVWAERFAQDNRAEIQSIKEIRTELEKSSTAQGIRIQAYSATGISLLAALFIIFTTLSMGVDERVRQFAMLRAIVLTKRQVAGLVVIEGALLGLVGWGVGLLAGWGLLAAITVVRPNLFPGGASLGPWCVVLSGSCAVGGALVASILPAWKATNVHPLDAMAPQNRVKPVRLPLFVVLTGLALIAVNPILVFYVPMPDAMRYGISAAAGCTTMAIGFVLLAPATIVWAEKFLGPVVAWLAMLNPRLLATQLTANLWRTTGTTVALTLGLGLFAAMQIWGYSMLAPFVPGRWTPDVLVTIAPSGLPEAQIDAVCHIAGVVPEQCLPLAFEQPKFAEDVTGAKQRLSVTRQDNCVIAGIDPQKAFGRERPMFDLRYVQGTRAEAVEKLRRGRYCLVPDHFQRESGLGIGAKIVLIPPESPQSTVEYEIAGVVAMDGWHLISKGGLRTRNARSAAMIFAPYDFVRQDFGIRHVSAFWMNLRPEANPDDIKAALQMMANSNMSLSRPETTGDAQSKDGRKPNYTASVNLQVIEDLRKITRQRADDIIWGLSQLPLVTLAVAAFGVMNAVLSSLRARRWEMGVLRAVGISRLGLLRLVLAEALLIGIAACLLSLAFGILAGYCGTEVSRYVNIHGGAITPLVVPWSKLLPGFGITLTLCLLAAAWPAIAIARTEPLQLLQSGRATM
jgi:putative ABC transport system permease protein